MANIFGKIFGFSNPKPNLNQGTPISFDIPGINDLEKEVKNRKIGFGADFIERTTSPFVQSRISQFEQREVPAIQEALASRGLSRSTIGTGQIGKAAAQRERDIQELLAQAEMQNLQRQKTDVSERDRFLFDIGNAKARQQALAAQNEQQRAVRNIGFDQQRAAQDTAALGGAISSGLGLVQSAFGGMSPILGALGGGNRLNQIESALRVNPQQKPAGPFITVPSVTQPGSRNVVPTAAPIQLNLSASRRWRDLTPEDFKAR